jgi:hypothetical protein
MTVKKKPSAKASIVKEPTIIGPDQRVRKKPHYKSFRLHRTKRSQHVVKIPSFRIITKKSLRLLGANKKNIFWFSIIFGLLYIVLVRGFTSPINVDEIRDSFSDVLDDETSALVTNFTVFSLLLKSTTSVGGEVASMYQAILIVLSILALIWLFRQQQAGHKVTMKQAYYRGMYPLVPFLLVFVVIALQTLPATIGNFLFTTVISSGVAVNAFEQAVWLLLYLSLVLLSFYMISSSLIALYIVTLPDMTPRIALKKAKELVEFRRFSLLRKVFALAVLIVLIFVCIVFPLIFVSSTIAQVVFFMLTVLMVPFATAYLFVLYRELL